MSLRFHWFLPTYGDSRNLMAGGHGSSMSGDRPATLKYLNQIGAAAETNGFEAVLTPTGAWCEDAWLTTAMMLETTETLKFLVALRPGLLSPTLAAQMAATFQWQSGGRLLLNVVTGGEDHEQRTFGDFLDKNQRYARCGEFLDVIRQLWSGNGPVDFSGEYVNVEKATLQRIPDPVPPIFFGGSSPAAGTVASRYADTYLTWGETPSAVAAKIAWIRDLAEVQGRHLDYGIRLHVISRTPRNRHGQKRIGCSVRSIRRPSSRLRRVLRDPAPKVSVGCSNCTAAVRLTRRASERGRWRLRRTCGPASDWCEGVQAPHWSVRTKKWLIGLPSTRRSVWITSYCRAIPISKRRISSVRACVRSSKSVDW